MFKKLLATVLALFAAAAFAAVDANKATQAELEAVKGIGPVISGKILDERKKAPFKDWNDMVERVKGVGEGNAAKFSSEGLTVNGAGFKGAPAAPASAKKDDKPVAAKAEEKKAPAAAVTAPATAAAATATAPAAKADAKKDDKPAATAKANDKAAKPEAKAPAKAEAKVDAKAEKAEKAAAAKEAKAEKAAAAKKAKEDKAAAAKPAAAKASEAKTSK
jgi:competence protein ComEA